MAEDARFTIQRFEAKCLSFGPVVQVFLNMKNGSDTSRTQPYHEARLDSAKRARLGRDARQRLKWMEHFRKYRNARLTCRHFGISPNTFYL